MCAAGGAVGGFNEVRAPQAGLVSQAIDGPAERS